MGFAWKDFNIKRFYGLDIKTNIVDVLDGKSLDADNVYVKSDGSPGKRPGDEIMFASDETGSIEITEVGTCTILGTKYYFKFANGKFHYATTQSGATTAITPSPVIATTNQIWWVVLDDKLFFVDGSNVLRYFNGTTVLASSIYARPTVAPTSASGGGGFTYLYTVDNGLGESPGSPLLASIVSAGSINVPGNTGPQTLVAGDVVRVYSRADTIAAASKLVGSFTWDAAAVTAGFKIISTVAIADGQTQLYTELGLAVNKSAPTGLVGITKHYSRLVGWKTSFVYNSKVTNPHSWPDDSAQHEAFVYGFGDGDGETINRCITYQETLYVLKPSDIAVFGGIGPDDTGNNAYTFRRLETNGKGCVAGKSVCTIGEKDRLMLVYLSKNGFMGSNGSTPIEIGEEIETVIQGLSETTLATSYAIFDARLGLYYCAVGGSGSRTVYVLDIRANTVAGEIILTGWFKWSKTQVKCMFYDKDRAFFGQYNGLAVAQKVAGVSGDFSDVKQEFIATTAINTGSEVITVTQVYATGDIVVMRTNGTIPAGLTANTSYYVIYVSDTTIKLATSLANAQAGTSINITSQGAGTHSLVGTKAIAGYYDTNWICFGKPLMVKKLGKVGLVFNAIASSVSLTIQTAYDWVPTFTDPKTVTGGASNPWGTGAWGTGFVWGGGSVASPLSYALPRRKVRSIRFKFSNNTINQDFNIQALNIPFAYIRNRGNFG